VYVLLPILCGAKGPFVFIHNFRSASPNWVICYFQWLLLGWLAGDIVVCAMVLIET
jgi:hypothetical protein